jgi:hypothetical protein
LFCAMFGFKFVNRPIFHRESCSILSVTKFSISILIFANLSPHLRRKEPFLFVS